MKVYVIIYKPEKKLYDFLWDLKQKCHSIIGDQLYLLDPPHITLFVGYLEDGFIDVLKTLSFKDLSLDFDEWHSFEDQITNKITFSTFAKNSDYFRKEQLKLVNALKPFIPNQRIARYSKIAHTFTNKLKENYDIYGYPYIGDVAKAHLSLGSISKHDFQKIKFLLQNMPKNIYKTEGISIYELRRDETLKLVVNCLKS